MHGLPLLQVQESVIMDIVLYGFLIETGKIILCWEFKHKDFEICLAGQAVLQISQISKSCVITSMSYKIIKYFEDTAQCIHIARHTLFTMDESENSPNQLQRHIKEMCIVWTHYHTV